MTTPSEFLLVPINVQARVVNARGEPIPDLVAAPRTDEELAGWYADGTRHAFSFARMLPPLERGIHLHWVPPAALMHTRHHDVGPTAAGARAGEVAGPDGSDEPEQCSLPDRWLVLRLRHAPGERAIQSRAWVVESDYVADDPSHGGVPFPWRDRESLRVRYVGRAFDADGWEEKGPSRAFDLKASGWGDPSFAAFYPACRSVLGFHDKVDDLKPDEECRLTYLVAGWYSASEKDPLAGSGGLDDRLKGLSWSCAARAGVDVRRTVCHGTVLGVAWPTASGGSAAGPGPTIAIGGSAAEALAAVLAHDGWDGKLPQDTLDELEQVLCAFLHGQASQVAGRPQLVELLHQHGFAATPGGTLWTLEPTDARRSAAGSSPSPAPSANVWRLLARLDEVQAQLDRAQRELESVRWQVFAAWVMRIRARAEPPADAAGRSAQEAAGQRARETEARVAKLRDDVERRKAELHAVLEEERVGLQAVGTSQPPFLAPKDPFVVILDHGVAAKDRTEPRRPDASGALCCRTVKDIVTGWEVSGVIFEESKASECFDWEPGDAGKLPLEDIVRPLALESLVLLRPDETDRTWLGVPPDDLALTRAIPEPTWLPVYLAWRARWSPSPRTGSTATARGDQESTFDGATIAAPLDTSPLISGLEEFARQKVARFAGVNVLGQSLGGFNDLLLGRRLATFLPPIAPGTHEVDAAVWDAMGRTSQPTVPSGGTSQPVREGDLKLERLYVVDAFGDTRRILDDSVPRPKVVASAALRPTSAASDAHLGRALAQPARLDLEWQPPRDGDSAPVCGWLVPNHLERSLAVFSARGDPLGALESVLPAAGEETIESKVAFRWRNVPGTAGEVSGIEDADVRRFVGLVAQFTADEGQAFAELVELVLSRTEGRGPPEDPFLPTVLGRPLALVRASVGLALEGLPAGRWQSGDPWTFETEGLPPVAVRLGDMTLPADGLVGYLRERREGGDVFFAAHRALRRLNSAPSFAVDQDLTVACGGSPVPVLLLMDAAARVHASADLLPRVSAALPAEALRRRALLQELHFQVAPVLIDAAVLATGPAGPRPMMPRPSDAFGHWTWAPGPNLGKGAAEWREIEPADDRGRFVADLLLTEGWLRLRRRPDGTLDAGDGTARS